MPTIIAVDAMGTDKAPKPEVEGAMLAARHCDVSVLMVGREEQIRAELEPHLCRCGTHMRILRAVHRAIRLMDTADASPANRSSQ